VEQYVERNFPELYPDTKSRFKAYIKCLLQSDDVVSMLDEIAAYTDPNLESELVAPGGESRFFMLRELHPLVGKYQDLRYQTVIAYSRYFKDKTLFEMIANWFLDGRAEVVYGGIASWPVVQTMDEQGKAFDQGYTMDMYVQSLHVVMFRLFYSMDGRIAGDSFESLAAGIDKIQDLLILVTPARVPVVFNTVPMYYVGLAPYEFESNIDTGNLYVKGEGVSVNPNRPFYLEDKAAEVHLAYEGDLDVEMEDGGVFIKPGVFSKGMSVLSSPFEDPDQMEIISGLRDDELGSKDSGYYAIVESNVVSQYYSISREGRRLKLLLEGPFPISRITIFSAESTSGLREVLSDIKLEFDPGVMRRYIRGLFPLYSVQVLIDFS
jgi:hypothetical protein